MEVSTINTTYLLLGGTLLAAFIGAIVSSGIMVYTRRRETIRQREALLVAFTTDLTERFMRATMYYNQNKRRFISYSALHEATNPSMLAKLAEVIKDKNIIHTIIELNNTFFQIQRHVLEASKSAAEQYLLEKKYEDLRRSLPQDHPDLLETLHHLQEATTRALSAQGRALAFYSFDEMLEWIKVLIKYAREHAEGSWLAALEVKLHKRLEEKREADLSSEQTT